MDQLSFKRNIFILHRYLIYANKMRRHFKRDLTHFTLGKKEIIHDLNFLVSDHYISMSYWYVALYIVIEGWKELNLHDMEIDQLLDSPNVDLLRRYRHGVCHFQKTSYFHNKLMDFISSKDSAIWVNQLHDTLSRYFLEVLKTLMP